MAISLSAASMKASGKTYEPILEELLFENKTIGQELVAFDDNVKADTEITEVSSSVTMQAYSSGAPSSNGTLTSTGTSITPVKVMYYQEFDPNTLRQSRYGRDMKAGAWNTVSGEFEKVVLGLYSRKISYDAESKWYNNILSATQVAIAALTPGSGQASVGVAEQTYAAALTAGQFDGLVTRMIYNGGALGGRVKVAGSTINASNVKDEYDLLYAAAPAVVLDQTDVAPRIYAPYSHRQYITAYNNNPNAFKDAFVVEKNENKALGKMFSFNGVEIVFVPLPENCMILARPNQLLWATDLVSDISYMKIDYIASNRDDMFIKHVFTIFAHVMNQDKNVLYLG
jgi:hypothetical protein